MSGGTSKQADITALVLLVLGLLALALWAVVVAQLGRMTEVDRYITRTVNEPEPTITDEPLTIKRDPEVSESPITAVHGMLPYTG